MADSQDQQMNGEDFTQDVKDGDVQMNGDQQNGAPARDDDRYVIFKSNFCLK